MLRHMLRLAPKGEHHAFEPLQELHAGLARRFGSRAHIHCVALSDARGEARFHHAVERPAYSGFRPRDGAAAAREITVRADTLDSILPSAHRVDFMKVDVEGAEARVFAGAVETLARCQPLVVFEHGLPTAAAYGETTAQIFALLHDRCGLAISLLAAWLEDAPPLTRVGFSDCVFEGRDYYFIAHPLRGDAEAGWR
jgi:FkbM family methyltransferase